MTALRNVAIIAHVDHGKTTLVDAILRQSNIFRDPSAAGELILDSNDLERERGITILSKNVAVSWKDTRVNLIDTPGHGDFGGQVERVLNMADGVILLVDAFEGPMPQTRFVLDKALRMNLVPIVIINKIDKPTARPEEVEEEILELFMELEASNEQLDFTTLYASGKNGWVSKSHEQHDGTVGPLMDAILDLVPAPEIKSGAVQLQVTTRDYSEYLGHIAIGRVARGTLSLKQPLAMIRRDGTQESIEPRQLLTFEGLGRVEAESVQCGDLCAVVGVDGLEIGATICSREEPEALPLIAIDEPTLAMVFRSNDSPFFGRDGKYVTSRHLRDRLMRESERDTAIRIEDLSDGDGLRVSGRGVLHLSVLIETMRREGFEMSVSQPVVITKQIEGKRQEPMEQLTVDVPAESANKVMELVQTRRGELVTMELRGERQRLIFHIPTRGLVGLRSRMLTATAGEAVMAHRFVEFQPWKGPISHRIAGVLVSMAEGPATGYAIDALQARGTFFIEPNDVTYEGMIVGEHTRNNDLVVNVQKGKQLTNVRASGSDKAIKVVPPRKFTIEEALEYIEGDELVEITPAHVRLRKRFLKEHERKKAGKMAEAV